MKQKQLNFVTQKAALPIVYVIVGLGVLNWIGSWKFAGGLVGWFSNTVVKGKYSDPIMPDSNV
ncbi:hypothetical protein [Paenibacillus etheri]|uniref:Uncharacterized protein n=1 Tax=Paenibacillus etheri TaxID=1306852 RepID=A0A0W1AR95_9BACL|nr:hypothetical protein [Paenibacillus etheri]KTD83776.1 hypothetical protein UQ64_26740 [Paenibacillus etheri]